MKRFFFAALAGAAFLFPSAAWAADLPPASEVSPWMVRLRGIYVYPMSHSKVKLGGTDLRGHGNLYISKTFIPELDISYFFTENIAAELILGVTRNKVRGERALNGVGTVGKTWLLPPTLTLQYHLPLTDSFTPYIGAGLNYTVTFGETTGKNFHHFRLDNSWGLDLQAGFDLKINDHWGVNFDVKKIWMRPHAKVSTGGVPVRARVHLDPWMIGGGVSYRF